MFRLRVIFGSDQKLGIDAIIERMQAEGKVIAVEVRDEPGEGCARYSILFDSVYSVYLFGHVQSRMFQEFFNVNMLSAPGEAI
jgi:hypothetical protein